MALEQLRDKIGERRMVRGRIVLASVLIGLGFIVLVARIGYLQIVQYDHFSARSHDNRVRIAPISPTRGLIYDRQGRILAENRPAFRLSLIPEQINDLDAVLDGLDRLIGLSDAEREAFHSIRKRSRSFQEIPLKSQLSDEAVAQFSVNRHRFPGVEVRPHLSRYYPYGSIGAHAIGYVGRISEQELRVRDRRRYRGTSLIGKTGVERAYEAELRGEMGLERIETNALGRSIDVLHRQEPVPGDDLRLTLDIELQATAEAALGDYRGAIVALDPRNGAVLALVSQPTFDSNALARGLNQKAFAALGQTGDQPLFNRALRGRYPPGSIVKPFLGLAAAATGHIDPAQRIHCDGKYHLPNVERTWRDWKPEGHGNIDLIQSIAQSCDIYYYDLAYRMGIDAMHDWMTDFGFGQPTGIDLPGERTGVMPSRAWKQAQLGESWYHGETINTGIGQGFTLATPVQMAASTALIANRGRPIQPHILAQDPPPESALPPVRLKDEALWQITIDAMIEVTEGRLGTAREISQGLPYSIAGKTGTAQVIEIAQDEEYDAEAIAERFRDHALFAAFAPAIEPRIALAVVVENGGSGSQTAAPIAREVITTWLNQLDAQGDWFSD